MSANEWQIKKEMCEIGERIWQKGFCAGNEGNHSVRVGDNRVLVTPSGISKGLLSPDIICTCDLEGNVLDAPKGWTPSSERKVHNAIYRHRPDVKAVVHSHPPHATAFAIANIPLPEGIHPEAEVFLGRVPVAEYATPSTEDLPNSILPHVGPETNSVLMGNHGTVSFSDSLRDAYYKLEILDAYCRVLLLCKQLGKAEVLSNDQMASLLEVKQSMGLQDPRAACASDGCVGTQNEPFFAQFDVRPAGACCEGDGGAVAHQAPRTGQASANGQAAPADDEQFEQMVQLITDQIMASAAQN
jgi:L-fuculose-phosphate aldolase